VFASSDALAHYILMMYEVANKDRFADELQEALNAQTKNSNFIKLAIRFRGLDFATKVIKKLENCRAQIFLDSHLAGLRRKGLIALDDYSLAIL